LVQAARQLVVAMREETTVQIQYLIQLHPQAAAVVVLRLFLLHLVKMVVRAAVEQKTLLVAQGFLGKAITAVQQIVALRHLRVVVAQGLLVGQVSQALRVPAEQVVLIPLRDQALHMLVVEAGVDRLISLLAQVERAVAVQVEQTALLAQQDRQILAAAAVRPAQTVETHPALAVQALSSSKCRTRLAQYFQAA
jgi:hypothetical protein